MPNPPPGLRHSPPTIAHFISSSDLGIGVDPTRHPLVASSAMMQSQVRTNGDFIDYLLLVAHQTPCAIVVFHTQVVEWTIIGDPAQMIFAGLSGTSQHRQCATHRICSLTCEIRESPLRIVEQFHRYRAVLSHTASTARITLHNSSSKLAITYERQLESTAVSKPRPATELSFQLLQ